MSKLILPGLIDPHVHLRDPGQTNKEDFYTGTCAGLAGGFTTILDMPNNRIPIITAGKLKEKIKIAKEKIVCDVGFHFGSLGDNLEEFNKVKAIAFGLKLYLSLTTGGFVISREEAKRVFKVWPKEKVILLHAEDDALDFAINLTREIGNRIHICHVNRAFDLKQVIKAKERGLRITCGVTPHYLFLTDQDAKRLGPYGKMKPPLQNKHNQDFLWNNLKFIDIIESDHAPHTIEEKEGEAPPFGVPGLETTLPLLLTAVSEKRLTTNDIVRLCHIGPSEIFGIKTDQQTRIEIDLDAKNSIRNASLLTKCKWSPFNDWKVKGKVRRVFIRGKKVFEDGKILAKPGSGKILKVMYN
jgi:dihydroorotase